MKLLPHLLRPARGGAAAVVVVFALLLTLAVHAGFAGIPLAFILTSWFFKYSFILFDHTVWGFDEPPALEIEMMNPLDEQRPLAEVLILGLIYAAVKLVEARFGAPAGIFLAGFAALLLPASVAVLGLERNPFKAVYPLALAHMIRGLGAMYPLVLAAIAGCLAVMALSLRWVDALPLEFALAMFGILSMFSLLGGVVFERRHELGIDTRRSPERAAERGRRADLRDSDKTVMEAYAQMRVGQHAKAWAMLEDWLAARGHAIADYGWLCGRLGSWGDARYVNRLTEQYVERLLALREDGLALDVVAERLAADPGFRPKSAAATLRIAQLGARGGGKPAVARALLADFGTRFAGDAGVGAAAALAEHLR